MDDRSNRVRVSSLVLALAVGPVALAGPPDEAQSRPAGAKPHRVVLAMYQQQGTTGGAGTATPPDAAKSGASKPPAATKAGMSTPPATPKAEASPRSALPKAGANSTPSGPGVAASRNPYHAETREMRRQSSRLKAQGFGGNVMNDGEVVQALDATIKLLAKVEDGYGGHRAGAIQEIENAIKQIRTKTGKSATKLVAPSRAGHESMPRAEADACLREAHKSLEKIIFNIAHGGNVKRLAPARDSAKKAIQELDAALQAR